MDISIVFLQTSWSDLFGPLFLFFEKESTFIILFGVKPLIKDDQDVWMHLTIPSSNYLTKPQAWAELVFLGMICNRTTFCNAELQFLSQSRYSICIISFPVDICVFYGWVRNCHSFLQSVVQLYHLRSAWRLSKCMV